MGGRFSTAIEMADTSSAILQRVEAFDWREQEEENGWDLTVHMGIDPMLLALSMELALKAWYVFDYDTQKVKRSHNLLKLFEVLKPESKEKLDTEFRKSVAPSHPSIFYVDYGIDKVLLQHMDAFVDWRYPHDVKRRTIKFEQYVFIDTLKMVLVEFRKRYREVPVQTPHFP